MDVLFKAMENLKTNNNGSLAESYQKFQSQYGKLFEKHSSSSNSDRTKESQYGLPYRKDR